MSEEPTIQVVVDYYHNFFVPAYADLVAFLGDKPVQVLVEIENYNSHMMRAMEDGSADGVISSNLKKAKGHLQRGTLDCYKLLFVHINRQINQYFDGFEKIDIDIALGHTNFHQLFQQRQEFIQIIRQSRTTEMQNVGVNIEGTIESYRSAVNNGFDLVELLSNEYPQFERVKKYFFIKQLQANWGGYVISAILGVVVTLIVSYFTAPGK